MEIQQPDVQKYVEKLKIEGTNVQVLQNPSPEDKKQILETYIESQNGDKEHQGEISVDYCLGKDHLDKQDPYRLELITILSTLSYFRAQFFGLQLVIRDETTKDIVGIMSIIPPEVEKSDSQMRQGFLLIKSGIDPNEIQSEKWASVMIRGKSAQDFLGETGKKYGEGSYAMQGLYIKPQFQGKGYGTKFVKIFNDICQREKTRGFLTCNGEANKNYYQKHGWVVKESTHLKDLNDGTESDHLFYAMTYDI